jgi:hypothetical protein
MADKTLTLQWKDPDTGKWSPIPLDELRGQTLGDIMAMFDGREVVAEYINGDQKAYFCGTEKWLEYYREKGFKVMGFAEATERIRKSNPGLVDWVAPIVEVASELFPSSSLEKVEQQDSLFC